MNNPDYSSPEAKLTRAREHFDSLAAEFEEWNNSAGPRIVADTYEGGLVRSYRVRYDSVPDLTRWALIAGDCAHNVRTALDHFVGVHGGRTFPVLARKRDWEKSDRHGNPGPSSGLSKVANMSRELIAGIEALQPYNNPVDGDPKRNLLYLVHQIDRQDKHATLAVANFFPTEANATIDFRRDAMDTQSLAPYSIQLVNKERPLHDNTEVMRVNFASDAEAQAAIRLNATIEITLAVDVEGTQWDALPLLEDTAAHVERSLNNLARLASQAGGATSAH